MAGESIRAYGRRLAPKYNTTPNNIATKYHENIVRKGRDLKQYGTEDIAKKNNEPAASFQKLPKSDAGTVQVVQIQGKKILALYDIHCPYHDVNALHCAINEGVKRKCDAIFLGGDIVDAYELSRFEKDKKKRSWKEEIQITKQFFSFLRWKFPKAKIYYLYGNHCLRYQAYIRKNASALDGIEQFEFKNLFDFERYGIEDIDPKAHAKYRGLSLVHGHEWGSSTFSPVNVARGLYTRAKASAMCGHSHQTSEHTETNINGEITTCWSVGCLSEIRPDYSKFSKYNQGFAIIEAREKDGFHVTNYRIRNGKIL